MEHKLSPLQPNVLTEKMSISDSKEVL